MKTASIIGAIIVIIVIIGGVVFFRSTEPNGTPADEGTPAPAQSPVTGSGGNSNFIQVAPTDLPTGVDQETGTPDEDTSPNDTSTSTTSDQAVTISIDEAGFTPQSVTVAVGATVTFVNNGQAPHWPASDVHPTHEILPAFDSKGGLETGEEYSFTFTEAGTWPCHDHLAPSNTCTITVK